MKLADSRKVTQNASEISRKVEYRQSNNAFQIKQGAFVATLIISLIFFVTGDTFGRVASSIFPKNSLTDGASKSYTGKVGKLEANYKLKWNTDGTMDGEYYYTSKPGVKYILKGLKKSETEIQLTEYTDGKISAICNLSLQGSCYKGQMNNTDGRKFQMTMCVGNSNSKNAKSQ